MKIEITHGVNTSYPIAIIPFVSFNNYHTYDNKIIEDISSIITSDLRNSGKFNTLPISYLPHQPTQISDIIPMFWEKLGINKILLGSINIDENQNYTVSYQLIDTSSNPALVILENQYLTKKQQLRKIAHIISNEIFEKLTGIKGAFCTHIAYILYTNNNQYPYELCISDYDGYNQISIYKSTEPLMSPAWSPDGKKIAYVSFSSGHSKLIIQNLSTKLIENTVSFSNHNGAPAFSPDGKKLAFSSSTTGSLNLYIMELTSKKIYQLTTNRYNNTEPSWFPDSYHLAYTSDQGGSPQIYKINIHTMHAQQISWSNNSNQNPHVNTDGNYIIMINRNQNKQNISKLNLETGDEEILTTDAYLVDTPSLAPNGAMIIYSAIRKNDQYIQKKSEIMPPIKNSNLISVYDNHKYMLELISIDGKFKAYLHGSNGRIRFPTWSPF